MSGILGDDTRHNYCAGNAILADLVLRYSDRNALGDTLEVPAMALEERQLREVMTPAANLLDVQLKLALAVRQGHYVLRDGPVCEAVFGLINSCLSDVILLRQAELRRREALGDKPHD